MGLDPPFSIQFADNPQNNGGSRPTLRLFGAAGWVGPIIFTEVGTKNPSELLPALAAVPSNVPVYVYALYSPDDGYTLTAGERDDIARFTGAKP